MKLLLPALLLSISLVAQRSAAQTPPASPRVQLPNGWSLTPAGASLPLSSDLPLNIALAPDGVHAAITNNGNGRECIDLIDLAKQKIVATATTRRSWLGLQFAKKSPFLYASGGNDNCILRFRLTGDTLIIKDSFRLGRPWPAANISPTGLALDENHQRLYVVTKEDEALYVFDTRTTNLVSKTPLHSEAYTCLFNPAAGELYISAWGGRKVWVYNTVQNKLVDSMDTEDHPTDMALDTKRKRLFVANANSNSVSVIDLASRKPTEILHTALSPDAPIGSTPNSVALSSDDHTLYIANADNNSLAVYDVSDAGHSRSTGFIPVGWYPSCVRVAGGKILVANGKGLHSMPNPDAEGPMGHPTTYKSTGSRPADQYVGSMLKGVLSIIETPSVNDLAAYSQQVYANTPYSPAKEQLAPGEEGNPVPRKKGDPTPIKYVFYVLKENRTYDQLFGDLPQGNGDTSLCLFGKKITPNAHALAEEFVLLDNFYVDAEVSADGHNWSMAAYATDFVEKNWPYNYSGRGGDYDFDGHRPVANPTKGFIWDYCNRAGVSFRNYGEFEDNGPPTLALLKQKEHYCKPYPGWNLGIQDIYRESVFEHDFDSLLATNSLPRFCTIYLPNDHTSGLHKGAYTPIAQVADNDLAFGRLVDHISHSPIWKESAIFVLEDDAQDGPDHVDAHRSPAFVISPFIRKHTVDHTLYSTSSILRTMELILGLPPMSQYDAAATPLFSSFGSTADTAAFAARPAGVDINARNTASNAPGQHFNLSDPDRIPEGEFNAILWKAIKGENSPVPQPRRSAFVRTTP
jgi:YVTN family beta-propeller protein